MNNRSHKQKGNWFSNHFRTLPAGFVILLALLTLIGPTLLYAQAPASRLDEALQIAAHNSPILKARYAEFEAALQKVAQVHALPDPTFSMGVFVLPVQTRVGPQRARFSLSQMFPWFGTLAARRDAAALMAEATYQTYLNSRNELFFKVKAAWYPLYEVHRLQVLQAENLEILNTFKQLATVAFQNGKTGMVDVIRVDLMLDNTRTEIKILEAREKPLLTRLNTLLNRADTVAVILPDSLPLLSPENEYRKDSLFAQHPMLAAYDLKIQSARAQELAAKKQGLPSFGVGLDYVLVDKRSDMVVPQNGMDILMPMVTVSIPIWRAKYKAQVKESQFMQTALSAHKEDFQNELLSNYEMSAYELERSIQLIELYRSQIQKTRQVLSLLLVSFSNSGKDFEEVLRMQQELLKYQMAEAVAIKDFYTALAKLDFLTSKS